MAIGISKQKAAEIGMLLFGLGILAGGVIAVLSSTSLVSGPQPVVDPVELSRILEEGEAAKARPDYEAMLANAEVAFGASDPRTIEVRRALAKLQMASGDRALAHRTLTRALSDSKATHGAVHARTAAVMQEIGANFFAMNEFPKALDWLRQSVAIYEELGLDAPEHMTSLALLAMAHQQLGHDAESRDYSGRLQRMERRLKARGS